jgi:hypothetical protein
LGSNRILVKQ